MVNDVFIKKMIFEIASDSYSSVKKFNLMRTINILLVLSFLFWKNEVKACSIFCAADGENILVAGNEDWSDPFTKIWVHQKSKTNYGALYIGHSDYQAQFGINEWGLTFDFTAIPRVEGKNLEGKESCKEELFLEILSNCKNLKEALVFLNKYKYSSPYSQAMISDSEGNSAVVNQDGIIIKSKNYQIITNFNYCNSSIDNSCKRYEIIENSLANSNNISISLFKKLLCQTHQENEYPTQFSYIIDQNSGEIHLFSFHNYEDNLVLKFRELIGNGFMLKNLKDMLPPSFAELDFRMNHPDSLKQKLIDQLHYKSAEAVLNHYQNLINDDPKIAGYPYLLIGIAASIIGEVSVRETGGKPFYFWWYPTKYFNYQFNNPLLSKTLKLLTFLEKIPKDDPKQNIGAFEFKAIIYAFQGNKTKAEEYLLKTINIAPEETGNYKRSVQFLNYLKKHKE